MLFGQLAQLLAQPVMVWPARIFHAQGGVEFIRGLPVADRGHIHRHQLGQVGWEAGRRAVPHLFIVADQQVGASGRAAGRHRAGL